MYCENAFLCKISIKTIYIKNKLNIYKNYMLFLTSAYLLYCKVQKKKKDQTVYYTLHLCIFYTQLFLILKH